MPSRFALVVGNDEYSDPYRTLTRATLDAGFIGGFLTHRLGFEVTTLFNQPASVVENKLLELAKRLTDDSIFFFYFAGHGLCVGQSVKQSLLCRDATPLLLHDVQGASGAITPETLSAISRMGRGDMFFCLDVCRTQTLRQKGTVELQKGGAGLRDAVTRPNGKHGMISGRRLTLSSCADGQGANDDGAFVKSLVEELTRLLDGGFDVELGYDLVQAITPKLALGQTPQLDGTPFILQAGTRDRNAAPQPVVPQIRPVVAPTPTDKDELTTKAFAALNAGDFDEAERLATEALKIDPNFERAKNVMLRVRKEHDRRLKIEEFQRKLDQHLNAGWRDFNDGDAESAYKKAVAVLRGRPDDLSARDLKQFSEEALVNVVRSWRECSARRPGFRRNIEVHGSMHSFAWIPAGEFKMGSPQNERNRNADETLHPVKLTHGFWISKTLIKQSFYQDVTGRNPSGFIGPNLPVEYVNFDMALAFCERLNDFLPQGLRASLPTEAQWEYVCRAGTISPYWYGDTPDPSMMNFGKYEGQTSPVKRFPKNPWGIYDMHGNVSEWTLDWYGPYPTDSVVDPTGPAVGQGRVCRGGSWLNMRPGSCRSANRRGLPPNTENDHLGFRVVLLFD